MAFINNIKAAASTVTQGIKGFAHSVRVEYEAQKILAAQRNVEREQERIAKMPDAELVEYMRDTAEILQRASELHRAKRNKRKA